MAGSALLAAAFGSAGLRLVGMSDDDWRDARVIGRSPATAVLRTSPSQS